MYMTTLQSTVAPLVERKSGDRRVVSGSLVVDSLLIVTPIVGFCNCSVLLCVTLCPF